MPTGSRKMKGRNVNRQMRNYQLAVINMNGWWNVNRQKHYKSTDIKEKGRNANKDRQKSGKNILYFFAVTLDDKHVSYELILRDALF